MMNNLKNRYLLIPVQVRASICFLIAAFFQKGIQFITTPIFTRLLSTTEYGKYNVFLSWFGIFEVIVGLGLNGGIYAQGIIKFESKKNAFTSALVGLTILLVVMWSGFYILFADGVNEITHLTFNETILMGPLIALNAVLGFWSVDKRSQFDYKPVVFISIISAILNPVISIMLIKYNIDGSYVRIIGMFITALIIDTPIMFKILFKGRKICSIEIWKYALNFNIPLIPHYLSSIILNSSDRIMIEKIVGVSEAGIYSLAYSVAMIMMMFNSALLQTIEPWLYKKIKERRMNKMPMVAYSSFIAVALVNMLLILFAPEIIRIFAPEEYYDAIYVVPPVAMSVFFSFMYSFFATFEFYFEKTKYISFATSIGAVTNIILNYVFINWFGYIAAGYTTLLCFVIYAIFHYIFMNIIYKDKFEGKQLYDTRIIILISLIFVFASFGAMACYISIYYRLMYLACLFLICFIFRKKIIGSIKFIIDLRSDR